MLAGLDLEDVEDDLKAFVVGIRAQVVGVLLNSRFERDDGVQAVVVRCTKVLCI